MGTPLTAALRHLPLLAPRPLAPRLLAPLLLALALAAGCGDDSPASDAGPHDASAGPDAPPGSCAALDLVGCRERRDCTADICPDADCSAQFLGCRALDATPHGCPPIDVDCCQRQEDCGGSICIPPGGFGGCGACMDPEIVCVYDSDCDPEVTGQICEPLPCSCSGDMGCVPGCTADDGCGEAETCDTVAHRCQPAACSEEGPCPASFTCGDGLCGRTACDSDLACGEGFCVVGYCYSALGTCIAPPP